MTELIYSYYSQPLHAAFAIPSASQTFPLLTQLRLLIWWRFLLRSPDSELPTVAYVQARRICYQFRIGCE